MQQVVSERMTAVLGASIKRERYSNQALRMLREHGYRVIAVHPAHAEIEGEQTVPAVEYLPQGIDTITVYVGPEVSEKLTEAVIAKAPRRVIINPGAESPRFEAALLQAGISVERACTLVLLQTGQY